MVESLQRDYSTAISEGSAKLGIVGDGAVFMAALQERCRHLSTQLKNNENFAGVDMDRLSLDLDEAKKKLTHNTVTLDVKTNEKKRLQDDIDRLTKSVGSNKKRYV